MKPRHYSKRISYIRSIYDFYYGRSNGWNWKWARMEEMFHYRTNVFRERNYALTRMKDISNGDR